MHEETKPETAAGCPAKRNEFWGTMTRSRALPGIPKSTITRILFVALFVAPLFIHVQIAREYRPVFFAMPHTYSGDEPHYLLMLSSLIKDFDFEVGNNYRNARELGMNDAGQGRKRKTITHHSFLFNSRSGETFLWKSVFNFVWGKTNLLRPGVPYPRHPDKENLDLSEFGEYLHNPVGLPLFLSMFLWPFRYLEYSPVYDSFAGFVMMMIGLAGILFFYKLLRTFCPRNARLFTCLLAFGTPFWWYSRSLYPDILLCSLLLGSLYFLLVKKNYLVPGLLMGFSIMVKLQFLVVVAVFFLFVALSKKWKKLFLFSVPLALFAGIQLLQNYLTFGDVFFFGYISPALSTTPLKGTDWSFLGEAWPRLKMMLLSPAEGLLTFSPILAFSALGMRRLVMRERAKGLFIIGLLAAYFLFHWAGPYWYMGGVYYGPRHLVPIIPLLLLPLAYWYDSRKHGIVNSAFLVLVSLSVLINLQGVFLYEHVCRQPPWFLIAGLFRVGAFN
jgi:hypothetical protein